MSNINEKDAYDKAKERREKLDAFAKTLFQRCQEEGITHYELERIIKVIERCARLSTLYPLK